MLNFLKNRKNILPIIIGIVVVAGAIYAAVSIRVNSQKKPDVYIATIGTLNRSVSATGVIKAETSVDLSFQKAGIVSNVYRDVNAVVKKGDVLAKLENSTEASALSQAKGVLAEAESSYNLKAAKATNEDIDMAKADVSSALAGQSKIEVDLANANNVLENTKKSVAQDEAVAELDLKNAQLNLSVVQVNTSSQNTQVVSNVDNAVSALQSSMGQVITAEGVAVQTVDKIFGNRANSPFDGKKYLVREGSVAYITTNDLVLKNYNAYDELKKLYDALPLNASASDLKPLFDKMDSLSSSTREMNRSALDLLNQAITSSTLSIPELDNLRTAVSTSNSTFSTYLSSYTSAKTTFDNAEIGKNSENQTTPLSLSGAQLLVDQKTQALEKIKTNGSIQIDNASNQVKSLQAQLDVQKSVVQKAEAALNKVLASPRAVDLAPYRARIVQAQAAVQKAQSDYDKTLITSPMDGLVTFKDIDAGEMSVASKVVFRVIDKSKFHMDVNIPETEIDKISTDSKVSITFDNFDTNNVFEGQIVSIELGPTNVQDTVYYKVKVVLVKTDERIKTGMTADCDIVAAPKANVLMLPELAITNKDGYKKVDVLTNSADLTDLNTKKTVDVKTGIRGDGGMIEILDGLKAGDRVAVNKV